MRPATSAETNCRVCGSPGSIEREGLRDRLFDTPGMWSHRRCLSCGLVWLTPQPLPGEVPRMYVDYYTHDERHTEVWGRLSTFKEAAARAALGYPLAGKGAIDRAARAVIKLDPLRDLAAATAGWVRGPAVGRLLDVGCGRGDLLARARSLGWEVEGIELDSRAAEAARRIHGLTIHQEPIETIPPDDEGYEVVTIFHVLEHLLDPGAGLQKIATLLKPGGRCLLATPNVSAKGALRFGSNWVHWDPPRHLHLFEPRTAIRLASEAGFQVTWVRTSPRMARFTWTASQDIGRHGKVRWESARSIRQRAAAAAFELGEMVAPRRGLAGEEIVMELRTRT